MAITELRAISRAILSRARGSMFRQLAPRAFASLVACCSLAGCEIIADLPVITPGAPAFGSATEIKELVASVTQRGARMNNPELSVRCDLSLRMTPSRATPITSIPAVQGTGNTWRCRLPAAFDGMIRGNHVLQVQWLVRAGTTTIGDSGIREMMLDCVNPDEVRRREQRAVLRLFANPDIVTAERLIARGYIPTHGATSYSGMGVAFIRTSSAAGDLAGFVQRSLLAGRALSSLGTPRMGTPDVLFFRPEAGSNLTDPAAFANSYRLIGWAYARSIDGAHAQPTSPRGAKAAGDTRAPLPRPRLPCIPHHQWFIHSAGFHRPDGGFAPRPSLLSELPGGGVFHPDLWDVHLFRSDDGIAKVAMLDPSPGPVQGIPVTRDSYYHPTAYD